MGESLSSTAPDSAVPVVLEIAGKGNRGCAPGDNTVQGAQAANPVWGVLKLVVMLPEHWTAVVNRATAAPELEAVRHSVIRSAPLGQKRWVDRVVRALGLEATQRRRGRPTKRENLVTVARNST